MGTRCEAEATKVATDCGATVTWTGTTFAWGRPIEKVATAGAGPGLARWKVVVPVPVLVVWANRQTVLGDGEPRRRPIPPVAPEDHCCSSAATTPPDWAATTVPISSWPWTKSPTFSDTSCPAGTSIPW